MESYDESIFETGTPERKPSAADLDAVAAEPIADVTATVEDAAQELVEDTSDAEKELDAVFARDDAEEAASVLSGQPAEPLTSATTEDFLRLEIRTLSLKVDLLKARFDELEGRINDHNNRSSHKI